MTAPACKNCKWWGHTQWGIEDSSHVLHDWSDCEYEGGKDGLMDSTYDGHPMLVTRADFYCSAWQAREEEHESF